MRLKRFIIFTLVALASLSCVAPLYAQLKGGVKIGLNFSNLNGPSETDAAGNNLETRDGYTGFHIGPSFSYAVSDRFGLRGELLYSRKGYKYAYEGPGFRNFVLDNNQGEAFTTGTNKLGLSVNFVNVDLPLLAYARFGKFELSGGAYVSFLFQKVADGALQYSWKNLDGTEGNIELLQTHNYNRDQFGEGADEETIVARVNGRNATLPKTVGAYYDYPDDRGNLYKSLDYGLIGGASFYLSKTLFIGARLQYGLADLTNTAADISRQQLGTDGLPVTREDQDTNFTIQASVGFSF